MKVGELYFNFQNENSTVNKIPLREWLERERERLRNHGIFTTLEEKIVFRNKMGVRRKVKQLSVKRVAEAHYW